MSHNPTPAMIFDLGNVLIDWNPRYLYKKMFDDPVRMEWFLANICTMPWNSQLDAGASFAAETARLSKLYPEYKTFIDAYHTRWDEMVVGAIDGTVAIFKELKARGVPCFALSNWSDEKYQTTKHRFDFLQWFDGLVISGQLGVVKPNPKIYHHLFKTFALKPENTVFVDDLPSNIEAATRLGMRGIVFTSPTDLRRKLVEMRILG